MKLLNVCSTLFEIYSPLIIINELSKQIPPALRGSNAISVTHSYKTNYSKNIY